MASAPRPLRRWPGAGPRSCAPTCGSRPRSIPALHQEYRDRRAQDAGPVVAQIQAAGGRAVAVEADLSDPDAPARLFDRAEEQFGPVDILVNNATGGSGPAPLPAAPHAPVRR